MHSLLMFINNVTFIHHYRALHGRDQREKYALTDIEHAFRLTVLY